MALAESRRAWGLYTKANYRITWGYEMIAIGANLNPIRNVERVEKNFNEKVSAVKENETAKTPTLPFWDDALWHVLVSLKSQLKGSRPA